METARRAQFHRPASPTDPMTSFVDAPREFTSWQEEQLSWKRSCYLHTGLNPVTCARVSGPDAAAMLSHICTNNVAKLAIGALTHAVMVTPSGYITASGTIFRDEEDSFTVFVHRVLLEYHTAAAVWDVEIDYLTGSRFLFQLAGPRSLELLEAALGEDFHDIRFFRYRPADAAARRLGLAGRLRIARMGMAGTLAYELHGAAEDADRICGALTRAGAEFGLLRLGSLVYITAHHAENGFPNTYIHYPPAFADDEAMVDFMRASGWWTDEFRPWPELRGSMGPDLSARFVTPYDLGWQHAVSFSHDFIGRGSLEQLAEDPPRRLVTLEWNSDDIADAFRASFGPGARSQLMSMPGDDILRGPMLTLYNDVVLHDGSTVGMSMGRMYSLYYGAMISIAPINREFSALGSELTVLWGEADGAQVLIRAKVSRLPYLDLPRNEEVDVSLIPRSGKDVDGRSGSLER